jgi:uncharacterized lipoprotein YehR (DUF1307 family)
MEITMNKLKFLTTSLIALTAVLALSACDSKPETAGEKVDEAITDVGNAVEDAGEKVGEAATDAGNAIEDACENIKEGVKAKDKDC